MRDAAEDAAKRVTDAMQNAAGATTNGDKTTQLIIKADKGVAHGKVVNLMERAKQAGLTHLAIGTSGS
jgi:biopolymer transport protein ExbD